MKDIATTTSSSTISKSIGLPKKNVAANKCVRSKFNIKTTKLSPLCNLVSKSRNNIKTNRYLNFQTIYLQIQRNFKQVVLLPC